MLGLHEGFYLSLQYCKITLTVWVRVDLFLHRRFEYAEDIKENTSFFVKCQNLEQLCEF